MQETKLQKIAKIEEDSKIILKSIIKHLEKYLSHCFVTLNGIPYLLNDIKIYDEECHSKLLEAVPCCNQQFNIQLNEVVSKVGEEEFDFLCDKQLAVLVETDKVAEQDEATALSTPNAMEYCKIKIMMQQQRKVIVKLQLNYSDINAIANALNGNITTLEGKLGNLSTQLHKKETSSRKFSTRDEHSQVVVNVYPRVTKKANGHTKKMISKVNQANQRMTLLVDKQKQKLRENKARLAELETLISQHEKIAIQLNKEVLLSEQSRMQLKNQLEKAKRSNMVMKSKLETIEENYRMQSEQLERRCEELKRHNNSLMENVRLFNKVLIKLPSVVKQIVADDDELATTLQM